MQLTPHTKLNRECFAEGSRPSKAQWCEWIEKGVVRGKLIAGKPFVDANWFAANDVMQEPTAGLGVTAMDLLS